MIAAAGSVRTAQRKGRFSGIFLRRFLGRVLTAAVAFVLVIWMAFLALAQCVPELPGASDAPLVTARRTFDAQEQALVRAALHLDLPLCWNSAPTGGGFTAPLLETRLGLWCTDVLNGDLGESLEYRQPVRTVLAEHLPLTLKLGSFALLAMVLIAVPFGVLWARLRSARAQGVLTLAAALAASIPEIVLGTLLLAVFSREQNMVFAVLVLALGSGVLLAAHLRAALHELAQEAWARALRARGVSEGRIVSAHLLRHALSPVITLLGAALPILVSGSIVVEHLFGLQGMGEVAWLAATRGDMSLAMACIGLGSAVALVGWLFADVAAALTDPRGATFGAVQR